MGRLQIGAAPDFGSMDGFRRSSKPAAHLSNRCDQQTVVINKQ
jgi:hypothetical protein